MAASWHRIKTYAKAIGIAAVLALVVIFMFSNLQKVTVKFLWFEIWQAPTYALIFLVANGGIVVFLLCRRIGTVIREVRELRRETRARQRLIKDVKQEVSPGPGPVAKKTEEPRERRNESDSNR